jgi:hypothetical protein
MERGLDTSGEGIARVDRRITLIHKKFRSGDFAAADRLEMLDIEQAHAGMAASDEPHSELDTLMIRIWMRLYALRMERAIMAAQPTERTYKGICLWYRRGVQNRRRKAEARALRDVLTSISMPLGDGILRTITAQRHAESACHTPSGHDWKSTSIPLVSMSEVPDAYFKAGRNPLEAK